MVCDGPHKPLFGRDDILRADRCVPFKLVQLRRGHLANGSSARLQVRYSRSDIAFERLHSFTYAIESVTMRFRRALELRELRSGRTAQLREKFCAAFANR